MALALCISKQFIILSVGANPKPCNLAIIQDANSSVVNTNPNRINGLARVNLLKLQARVIRIQGNKDHLETASKMF